jgi:predicted membrane-bound mannosyltransferase
VVYSWAGERMPWLVVHPLVPLAFLAGIGFATLWESRAAAARVAAVATAALAALVLLRGTAAVAYEHPADPAEFLVYTQTSIDVPPVRDRILELDRRVVAATGEHPRIAVDAWGGTSWPWAWYLRDLPVAYPDMSDRFAADEWDVLVVSDPNASHVAPPLDTFEQLRFRLRQWWVVDYGRLGPGDAWRWFAHRDPWSPEGTLGQRLYVRKGLLSGATAGSG